MCVRNTAFFLKRALTTTRYVVYSPAHQTYSRCSVLRSFMHLQAPAGTRLHVDLSSSGAEMH